MLWKLFAAFSWKLYWKDITNAVIRTLDEYRVPKNLRQYYADMLMYLAVCEQYGIQPEV